MSSGSPQSLGSPVGGRGTSAIGTSRRWMAGAGTAIALTVLTAVLAAARPSLGADLVLYLLVIVLAAVSGGLWVAIGAALVAFLLANWFLTQPYHTLAVESADSVVALVVFVAVAVLVSLTVELGAQQRVRAARNELALQAVSRFTSEPLSGNSLTAVLTQVQELFGMDSVRLQRTTADGVSVLGSVGIPGRRPASLQVDLDDGLSLVASGPDLFAEDRGLLQQLADTAARAFEGERLVAEAARSAQLEEIDRLRSALLAAVGHDLRTPLAGVKAAVSSLRQEDVDWTTEERAEFLATIEHSADRLDDLISNLLAMSRLQMDAVVVDIRPVVVDEVVALAVLHAAQDRSEQPAVVVRDDLPPVLADQGLLERVIANLVDNAQRFSPPGRRAEVTARLDDGDRIAIDIVDHGPGLRPPDVDLVFAPFQHGDGSPGVGLGLTIARGFTEAMEGTLTPSETPGGGLTMTVRLPTP